jgi:hypothetical protein
MQKRRPRMPSERPSEPQIGAENKAPQENDRTDVTKPGRSVFRGQTGATLTGDRSDDPEL